ncbi:MAG: SGNH/GDSL hydrolase family protein [Phycisphaeraceae bacterium]
MRARFLTAWLVVLTLVAKPASGAITELIAFGDSLSDVGNISAGTFGFVPGGDYFAGRFSDGPVWVEGLAGRLGVANPVRSASGGRNYAYGGTTSGDGFLTVREFIFTFNFPNAGEQVNRFLGSSPVLDGDELITLWSGGNDLFDISGSLAADGPGRVAAMLANVETNIGRLTAAGARHLVVPNLPALGQTPDFGGGVQVIDTFVASYNSQLAGVLEGLNETGPAEIYPLDVFSMTNAWVDDPGRYGFVNTTDAYLDSPVGDVNGYVFFDGVHPTARAHGYLAQGAWQLVLGGDLDASGGLDAGDLLLILDRLGVADAASVANVDGDLVVDGDDALAWITELFGSVAGDLNLDRSVDLIDLSILAGGFGGTGDYLAGDASFDGVIDLVDLSILAGSFGFGGVVPEPGGFWLLSFGLLRLRKTW